MKYFTIKEMESSNTADRKKITNHIPEDLLPNMEDLVNNVLDPLREAYGKPIRVTSGYRCEALNKAVAGAKNSDHLKACAADIVGTPNNKEENRKLFELVQSLGLSFRQLIDEYNYSWVHVSYDKTDNKNQILHL